MNSSHLQKTVEAIKRLSEGLVGFNEFIEVAHRSLSLIRGLKPKLVRAVNSEHYYFLELKDRLSRPMRKELFVPDPEQFLREAGLIEKIVCEKPNGTSRDKREKVDKTLYTIQQSFGCLLDLVGASSPKRFGTIFENLLHAVIRKAALDTSRLQYRTPEAFYITDSKTGARTINTRTRSLQLDLLVGRKGQKVGTTPQFVWPEDIFCSVKTSSKERIAQVFHDASAIQRQTVWRFHRYFLLLHNDVQRIKGPGVGSTFIFGGFLSGARAFPLDGIYFVDAPPNVLARIGETPVSKEERLVIVEDQEPEVDSAEELGLVDSEVTRKVGRMSDFLCRELWNSAS